MFEGWCRSVRRYWLLSIFVLVPFMAAAGAQVRVAHAGGASAAHATSPVEVPSLRTETSRTVQNPDGSFTAEVSSNAMNYKDATGGWQPINSQLVRSSTPGFAVENAAWSAPGVTSVEDRLKIA